MLGVQAYKHEHSKLPTKKLIYIVRFKMVFGCNSVSEMEVSMVLGCVKRMPKFYNNESDSHHFTIIHQGTHNTLAHNTSARACNTGRQKEFTERKVGR